MSVGIRMTVEDGKPDQMTAELTFDLLDELRVTKITAQHWSLPSVEIEVSNVQRTAVFRFWMNKDVAPKIGQTLPLVTYSGSNPSTD